MAETVLASSAEKRKSESEYAKATKTEFNFTWKIDNFAFKTRGMKNKECLTSEPFSADGSKDVQWQLLCHPKGDSKDPQGFAYYVRVLKFSGAKLMMEAKFSILDANGTVLYKKKTCHYTFTKCPYSQGCSKFVSQKDLLEKYVKEDTLTLNCKLIYEVENISLKSKTPKLDVSEEHIAHHLGNLFKTGQMSDIIFIVGTQNFKAHKNILSARSQVFAEMFEFNGNASSIKSLKIEDCEPEVFEAMLRFLYTDQIQETEDVAKKLLPVAKKYQVKLLQHKCQEILLNYISTENCAELFMLADMQEALLLKNEALDYFRHRPEEVIKTAGWKILREIQPRLAIDTLECVVLSASF